MTGQAPQKARASGAVDTIVDFVTMSDFSRTAVGEFTVDGINAEVVEFTTTTSVEVTAGGLGATGAAGVVRLEFDIADLDPDFDASKPWSVVAAVDSDNGSYAVSIGADNANRVGVQRQKGSNNMQAFISVAGSTAGTATYGNAATDLAIGAFCPGGRLVQVTYEITTRPTDFKTALELDVKSSGNTGAGATLGGAKLHFDFYGSSTTKITQVYIRNYR